MMKKKDSFDESGYDGISDLYEFWCNGDENYYPSLAFYAEYLSSHEGPFLELGIGTGRIALEVLRNNNKTIIGVDISKKMLMECGKRYRELKIQKPEAGELQLIQKNIKDIHFTEQFEVVYLPFRTVGHLMTDKDIDLVFQRSYEALISDGRFVLDHYIFQREWAETHNKTEIPMYTDKKNNIYISDYYEYDFEKEMMKCSILFNGMIIQTFDFRWLSPDKILHAAINAGFTIENIYGSFGKDEFTKDSLNQIWEFKK